MKRGGEGPEYIRKTVDKQDVLATSAHLEKWAEWHAREPSTDYEKGKAAGLRIAVDAIENKLGLLEGHPTRGWW